jgi:hypothetical protein
MSAAAVPRLSPTEADVRLDRVRAIGAALGAALTDLQAHPGYQFLDNAPLVAGSLRRWTAAQQAVRALWSGVAAYRSIVERAEAVRQRRSRPGPAELTELDELFSGPAVILESRSLLLAEPARTGPATASLLGRLDRLHAELDEVRTLVFADPLVLSPGPGDVGGTGRLAAIRDELTEIELRALASVRTESAARLRPAEADTNQARAERVGYAQDAALLSHARHAHHLLWTSPS